jgi:hypothetical protein
MHVLNTSAETNGENSCLMTFLSSWFSLRRRSRTSSVFPARLVILDRVNSKEEYDIAEAEAKELFFPQNSAENIVQPWAHFAGDKGLTLFVGSLFLNQWAR